MLKKVFCSFITLMLMLNTSFLFPQVEKILHMDSKVLAASNMQIYESTVLDKIKGCWLGQMAGVEWGRDTEFGCQGGIMLDSAVPVWSPDWINRAFENDDLYVEIPFVNAMYEKSVNCSGATFGDYLKNSIGWLLHGGGLALRNMNSCIQPPDSGHYAYNTCSGDIDWSIESNFAGLIAPAQVNTAIETAWRAGHIMSYGDGTYGGVFVTAMEARAFNAASVNDIIEAGRQAVPLGSEFRRVIEDVIGWKNAGNTWKQTWQLLENKWNDTDRCQDQDTRTGKFNIDAKFNEAYVLIGLLYGNGDFEQSMRIAMRCGQDSDCNPSTVGGILGTYLGFSNIPAKWKSALDSTVKKFYASNYTFNDAVNNSLELARQALIINGGSITGTTWNIPDQGSIKPPILEQWPKAVNTLPRLNASAGTPNGRTVNFSASASDDDGIKAYQWFFGDLSYSSSQSSSKAYWAFNEISGTSASDSSGCGHTGTVNGAVWSSGGHSGNCLSFDGVNDYVSISDSANFKYSSSGSFTLSAWVYIPSLPGKWSGVVTKGRDTAVSYGIWISADNRWDFGGSGGNIYGSSVATGWHNVVIVQNGTFNKRYIYVDGALQGSGISAEASSTSELWIGGAKSVSEYFSGKIDSVHFYNRAWSSAEILSLYNDITAAEGANVSHTYLRDGYYEAVCYVTDNIGNTACKVVPVNVGNDPGSGY